MLTGGSLRWMLGRRLLGTGSQVTVAGLPAGAQRIRLVARDRFGRTASASVLVRLGASRPVFLTLRIPAKISRHARSLRLTIASSVPARLVIRGAGSRAQQFAVGRASRRVFVHVRPGASALRLSLSLSAAGRSTSTTELVTRK
jgi:hypothetical protein